MSDFESPGPSLLPDIINGSPVTDLSLCNGQAKSSNKVMLATLAAGGRSGVLEEPPHGSTRGKNMLTSLSGGD